MLAFDLNIENEKLEGAHPKDILLWAFQNFGPNIAATSSFQTQSVPLLHMIGLHTPDLPILFLNTGFHFPETLLFRDQLIKTLGIQVQNLTNDTGHDGFTHHHERLYLRDPDRCCFINKVEPLDAAKLALKAWVTGIRRDQTPQRANTPILSRDSRGRLKICPLATWTRRDVWRYIAEFSLPEHPLLEKGYTSIGCEPCTRPVGIGEDDRAGRWAGQTKTECGLHYDDKGGEKR